MNKKRKNQLVLILIAVLGILFIGFASVRKLDNLIPSEQRQYITPDNSILAQSMAQEGWQFIGVDPNHPKISGVTQSFLSEEKATDLVNSLYPDLQKSPDLKGITAHLGILQNKRLQESAKRGEKVDPTFLKPRLVWIVTYAGIKMPSAGPKGADLTMSTEMNIVINAATGDYMMDFVWTR